MSKKISVYIKEPHKKLRHVHISNTLENLQRIVDSYIETVTISNDLVLICNEKGWINAMPYNFTLCGMQFFGTVIFAGAKDDEFADVTVSFDTMKDLFPILFRE